MNEKQFRELVNARQSYESLFDSSALEQVARGIINSKRRAANDVFGTADRPELRWLHCCDILDAQSPTFVECIRQGRCGDCDEAVGSVTLEEWHFADGAMDRVYAEAVEEFRKLKEEIDAKHKSQRERRIQQLESELAQLKPQA